MSRAQTPSSARFGFYLLVVPCPCQCLPPPPRLSEISQCQVGDAIKGMVDPLQFFGSAPKFNLVLTGARLGPSLLMGMWGSSLLGGRVWPWITSVISSPSPCTQPPASTNRFPCARGRESFGGSHQSSWSCVVASGPSPSQLASSVLDGMESLWLTSCGHSDAEAEHCHKDKS